MSFLDKAKPVSQGTPSFLAKAKPVTVTPEAPSYPGQGTALAPLGYLYSTSQETQKGFLKGVGSTLATVPESVGRVGQAVSDVTVGKEITSQREQLNKENDVLSSQIKSKGLKVGDPQYTVLSNKIKANLAKSSALASTTENRGAIDTLANIKQSPWLTPQNTAQSVGFGAEKLAEFFIPNTALNKLESGIAGGISQYNPIVAANKAIETATKAGTVIPSGVKAVKATEYGVNLLSKSILEGLSAGTVSMAQTGNPEEAKTNAEWVTGITMGLGVASAGLSLAANPFMNAARKLYQSAMKPSTAKNAPNAVSVVETGLKEGITLTEKGVQKTSDKIDELETQLGKVIDSAAGKGKTVPTAPLEAFVNDAKEILGNTVDVVQSKADIDEIDNLYLNLLDKYGDNIPIEEAQKLKTSTYQKLKRAYGTLKDATIEGMKALTRGIKEGIVDAAPQSGQINARLKKLYEFDQALSKAKGRIGNLNLLGIGSKILFSGDKVSKTLGLITEFLGSPGMKSKGAIWIYKFGNLLKGMSASEIDQLITNPEVRAFYTRLTGNAGTLTKDEQAIADTIGKALNDKGGFVANPLGDIFKRPEVPSNISGKISHGEGVIPPTNSLAQEAKKYKSAEEFVKVQGQKETKRY